MLATSYSLIENQLINFFALSCFIEIKIMKFKDSDRQSYLKLRCKGCIIDVTRKYIRSYFQDQKHAEYNLTAEEDHDLEKILKQYFLAPNSPNEIATYLFRKAIYYTQDQDPWKYIRDKSNQIALSLMPTAQTDIAKIIDPDARLFRAIEWSIAGNNIDFGTAGHEMELNSQVLYDIFTKVRQEGFSINHFDRLLAHLALFNKCLYICDNAGEIAFDTLVIKELQSRGVSVVAVVKGGPISNDAIYDDAKQVGLDKIADVITTGSADLGFFPYGNSPEFLQILNKSPLVIAKGQANWEAIYAYQDQLAESINFYSVFKIKCEVHAELLKLPLGSNLLYNVKKKDFKA
jgi:hypothetical protein